MNNRVVYVEAHFLPVGEYRNERIPTGEIKESWFGKTEETRTVRKFHQTGYSDSAIDAKRLAGDVAQVVGELNEGGYEVVSVTPITSATHNHGEVCTAFGNIEGGFGYGYGFTTGVMIVARQVARS